LEIDKSQSTRRLVRRGGKIHIGSFERTSALEGKTPLISLSEGFLTEKGVAVKAQR